MDRTKRVLLDSNIPMYAAGQEHPYRTPCKELLALVLAGRENAATNVEVHQGLFRRYLSIGLYQSRLMAPQNERRDT
jgi:predicted nucleic acid-binding protein